MGVLLSIVFFAQADRVCNIVDAEGQRCSYDEQKFYDDFLPELKKQTFKRCDLDCTYGAKGLKSVSFRLCLGAKHFNCGLRAAVQGKIIYGRFCGEGAVDNLCDRDDALFRSLQGVISSQGIDLDSMLEIMESSVKSKRTVACDAVDEVCKKHDACYRAGVGEDTCHCDSTAISELGELDALYEKALVRIEKERKGETNKSRGAKLTRLSRIFAKRLQASRVVGRGIKRIYNVRSASFYKKLSRGIEKISLPQLKKKVKKFRACESRDGGSETTGTNGKKRRNIR